jgi:hypothetical protein
MGANINKKISIYTRKTSGCIAQRRIAMYRAGITVGFIAEKCGVTSPAISQVMTGRRANYAAQALIAYLTGQPYAELWGGPAERPTAARAEKLRALGLVFCSKTPHQPFILAGVCRACKKPGDCEFFRENEKTNIGGRDSR